MREMKVKVCRFSELSEKVKESVKQRFASADGYLSADEAFASLSALAEHFNGKLKDYDVDFFNASYSSAKFDMPEDAEKAWVEERVALLGDFDEKTGKGLGSCVLTGYCIDEDAIDGLREAFREGERDLDRLMQAAFRSWLKACQSDCADFYSDESFAEHADANEMEFFVDGRMVKK